MSRRADVAQFDGSPAALLVAALIDELGVDGAHAQIDALLDSMSNVEAAAFDHDWSNVWARPRQVLPPGDWHTLGYLMGRGAGKTIGCSHAVNDEVEAGRAPLVCLIAQDEQSSIDLHVTGPSGLLAMAKPWFRPEWRASDLQLVWPNGSRAYVRTPEVPGKIRGLEYHLTWASELQSWPAATMEEAWMNVLISTRLGSARVMWDATAKRRHALLTRLLKDAARDPERCRVVRGSTYENALNLGRGYIEKIEAKYGGTRQGEEELFARMFDDAEGATAKQEWIDKVRRPRPSRFLRKVLSIDVAVTTRAGSDTTGIVLDGLGVDGQVYVLGDMSGKHSPERWSTIALDAYEREQCDCIVIETNKGGDLATQNLRAAAKERGWSVVVLGKDETPRHIPKVVYVREVYARGEKADRAKPLSTAYEKGRISHALGAPLLELEELLTTWIPTPGSRSPDRLDAHVHCVVELLGLADNEPDAKAGFVGITAAAQTLAAAANVAPTRASPTSLAYLLSQAGSGKI